MMCDFIQFISNFSFFIMGAEAIKAHILLLCILILLLISYYIMIFGA